MFKVSVDRRLLEKRQRELDEAMSKESEMNKHQAPSQETYERVYHYFDGTHDIVERDIIPKYKNNFNSLVDDIAGKENKGKSEYVSTEQALLDWLYDNHRTVVNNRIMEMTASKSDAGSTDWGKVSEIDQKRRKPYIGSKWVPSAVGKAERPMEPETGRRSPIKQVIRKKKLPTQA